MTVTKWTWWMDPNYIDIVRENTSKRIAAINSLNFPTRDEVVEDPHVAEKYIAALDKMLANCDDNPELEDKIREAVIVEIITKGYAFSGDCHQNVDTCCPVIDDKYKYCLSCRAWGELMTECYPMHGDYKNWAWINASGIKTKIPQEDE